MNPHPLEWLAAESIAAICGVDRTTARRWKRTLRASPAAERLLALVVNCDLGVISPDWSRWRIVDGVLMSPEGWRASPGEVMALPFMRQQIAEYARRRRVEVQADFIESRWVEPRGPTDRPSAALAEATARGARR